MYVYVIVVYCTLASCLLNSSVFWARFRGLAAVGNDRHCLAVWRFGT